MTTKTAMSTCMKPCRASSAAGQAILAGVELRGGIQSYHDILGADMAFVKSFHQSTAASATGAFCGYTLCLESQQVSLGVVLPVHAHCMLTSAIQPDL